MASSSATEAAEDSDPTRPFRRPLLAAPAQPARTADERVPLTDAEAKLVLGNVDALMQAQHPAQAISLLEDAAGRAPDPALALDLRRALAAALFYAVEYTRAAALFDEVGGTYRRYLPPADPWVLDCAYHAGHAYAETGNRPKLSSSFATTSSTVAPAGGQRHGQDQPNPWTIEGPSPPG